MRTLLLIRLPLQSATSIPRWIDTPFGVFSGDKRGLKKKNFPRAGGGRVWPAVITPATEQYGAAKITVTAPDGISGTTSRSFQLNVAAVNDPPTHTARSRE